MLWYKAWRESRTRFVLSALAIVGLCVVFVVFQREARTSVDDGAVTYIGYIWRITYKGDLRELFAVLVLLLGLGGLLRERTYGTANFTLGLPVSRMRLVMARAAVGLLEMVVLSFLPSVVIPALSPLVNQYYPWSQGLQFGLLWTVGGAFIFVMGFLASIVFAGEYSAGVAAFVALFLYSVVADLPFLEEHMVDVHDMMSGTGMHYFRSDSSLLVGPLPWTALTVILLVVLSLIAVACRISQRQDF